METLTCYRVGEQLFTNKEVALLYETIKTMLDNLGLSEVFSNPLFEVEEIKSKS